jgi:cyclic pyranopterin phosphate synthase
MNFTRGAGRVILRNPRAKPEKTMNDRYNREINYLRISVTDRCNLRCVYCMPKEGVSLLGHDDILRYEEILRVVRASAALGIVKARVTGGEPLVRRGLAQFLGRLSAIPGITDVSVTTNGILLADLAGELRDAGVGRVNVSLDSLKPERYAKITRGGDLRRVMDGIAAAHRAGLHPLKINMVPLKGVNEEEVLDFARLTVNLPYQVRFIELMPFEKSKADFENGFLSNELMEARIREIYDLEEINGHGRADGPAKMFRIRGAAGEIGFISSVSEHICSSCNRLRLTADGHLRSCLFSDEETDLKTPLRAGCSDEELAGLISQAISRKPAQSQPAKGKPALKKCAKAMSEIGG